MAIEEIQKILCHDGLHDKFMEEMVQARKKITFFKRVKFIYVCTICGYSTLKPGKMFSHLIEKHFKRDEVTINKLASSVKVVAKKGGVIAIKKNVNDENKTATQPKKIVLHSTGDESLEKLRCLNLINESLNLRIIDSNCNKKCPWCRYETTRKESLTKHVIERHIDISSTHGIEIGHAIKLIVNGICMYNSITRNADTNAPVFNSGFIEPLYEKYDYSMSDWS